MTMIESKERKRRKRMKKPVKPKYVTNKELLPEIISYRETWDPEEKKGEASEELGRMILLIARRYAEKGNFSNYTWKDDMIGEAVLTCMKYMHNFNPEKSKNPFAYITTICRNAFINHIKNQNDHSTIKDICYKRHEILYDGPVYLCKAINYQRLVDE